VILIVESPLSVRDAERFGLDVLSKAGLNPVVWEIGPLYLPRSELQWRTCPIGYSVQRFERFPEFEAATLNCAASDVVITLAGTQRGQLRHYRELLRALSLTPAKLATISAAPLVQVGAAHIPKSLSARARIVCSRLLRRPGVIRRAAQMFVHRWYGIRPLDFVWVATTDNYIEPLLVDGHSHIISVHSLDYDLVLRHRDSVSHEGTILLIDTMGPDHPDYVTHGENAWTISGDQYFAMMRDLLNQIEAASGVAIAVAAHPRAEPGSLDSRYGGRTVHYGSTAEAIAQARMVLLTNASTAVGLAVAMNKPMMMVRESCRPEADLRNGEYLVSQLKLAEWTTTSSSESWVWPIVDAAGYATYMSEFVKRQGTPDSPFWEVVIASLRPA
jgi:hypothetical protein